eukprot:GHVO01020552.1.p1 GENE.GHVO01020552.1~~GHVO01020552.1.p1  ORF type:complete len:381 (+),score=36.16 GHVO01020552.1:237-1379(+)
MRRACWIQFMIMTSQLSLISSTLDDNSTKEITHVVSSPVRIKTHVIWKPPSASVKSTEEPKLLILPLGAFLALIIATCAKISHWWNEDIREADGLLKNVYSAKYPNRPVLARVISTEPSPYDRFTRHPFSLGRENIARSISPIVIQTHLQTEVDDVPPVVSPSAASEGQSSPSQIDETVPLLKYHLQKVHVPTTDFTPMSETTPSDDRRMSGARKKKVRKENRKCKRKRLKKCKPDAGVSRLVMNSLNFNLFLLKLEVNSEKDVDHGFIEDSFIHPGEDVKQTVRQSYSIRRICPTTYRYIGSKPSTSSFSSFATSSTSLGTDFSESKHFYHIAAPRSASLSSDSGASSDVIWEVPDQGPEPSYTIENSADSNSHRFCVV